MFKDLRTALLAEFMSTLWALMPERLNAFAAILSRHQAGKAGEAFSPNEFSLGSQATALIVGEAWTPAQLLRKDSDFLLKKFDDERRLQSARQSR